MKILITGNRGFVGSYLELNLSDNHYLFGFDKRCGYDIRDKYQVEEVFDQHRFDVVIHLAARAGVRRSEVVPEEYISTNILGTKNLIDTSQRYGVSHFINFSSSSVFGDTSYTNEPLKEDDPKDPRSIYGMTKLMAEQIVERAKIPTTTIRPFTIYGEHGRKDMVIYKWIDQIKRGLPITIFSQDGKYPMRGFTHISDLINGVLAVLERDTGIQPHATYNLGGDQAITVDKLADIYKNCCEDKMNPFQLDEQPLPESDSMGNLADTTKAREELGWKPEMDFKTEITNILKKEL